MWDFSSAELDSRKYVARIDSFADRPGKWVCVFNGTRYYFTFPDSCRGSVMLSGFEKPGELSNLGRPMMPFFYDLAVGSESNGTFNASGLLYEKNSTFSVGMWKAKCSAIGTLITPEADTLQSVKRVDSRYTYTKRILPRDSVMAFPSPNEILDSLAVWKDGTVTVCESRWYAEGYRYPVVFATSHPLYGDSFFYAPVISMVDLFDPENAEIRQQNIERASTPSKSNQKSDFSEELLSYDFSQDKETKTLTVDYVTNADIEITFILADVSGIVYESFIRKTKGSEPSQITIPYGILPHSGAYILYISAANERRQEKFNY